MWRQAIVGPRGRLDPHREAAKRPSPCGRFIRAPKGALSCFSACRETARYATPLPHALRGPEWGSISAGSRKQAEGPRSKGKRFWSDFEAPKAEVMVDPIMLIIGVTQTQPDDSSRQHPKAGACPAAGQG